MGDILTIKEVRDALNLDFDYDNGELDRLSKTASSFIKRKTGYDFGSEVVNIEPLAKQAAMMYVKTLFYNGEGYNKEHDYSLGLNSLIVDLQGIAQDIADAKVLENA